MENIFNYDETNVTDDPGRKIVVVRHGRNQIERKTQHSKTSTSMFCGNAVGQFLPPMVVYKSENLYENWVRGDPKNAVYEVTPSAWFDWFNNRTFEIWFFKLFVKLETFFKSSD